MDSWIKRFCSLEGNEFFCQIEADYIKYRNNLKGLELEVPHYHRALKVILDDESDDQADCEMEASDLQSACKLLYGRIHARYIFTERGLLKMLTKYQCGVYGYCPRTECDTEPMLPIGIANTPNCAEMSPVKLFCPKCVEVYEPISPFHRLIDGAYFGKLFPDRFFARHPAYRPPDRKFLREDSWSD